MATTTLPKRTARKELHICLLMGTSRLRVGAPFCPTQADPMAGAWALSDGRTCGKFQQPELCLGDVEVKGRPDEPSHAALCLLSKAILALRRAASNFARVNASSG